MFKHARIRLGSFAMGLNERTPSSVTESRREYLHTLFADRPDTERVARFIPGPGFLRLPFKFDIEKLRRALEEVHEISRYDGEGLYAIPLTRKPGDVGSTSGQNNLSGLYWIRPDGSYKEFQREGAVEERVFSEFVPEYANTYFKTVYDELCRHMKIGRMRLLKKKPFDANSWHRDPEARIHIPIVTNPGSIMVVNNHCSHMPADGYVYFTDTRAYHMAVNGGEQDRVHLVATLPDTSVI